MAPKNRTPCSGTETVLSHVMLPLHTNHYGSIHGAVIPGFIDEVAIGSSSSQQKTSGGWSWIQQSKQKRSLIDGRKFKR